MREWCLPGPPDPRDPPWRLRLEDDRDGSGLLTISDEHLSKTGRITHVCAAVDLTGEEARWLYQSLGEAIAAWPCPVCHGKLIEGGCPKCGICASCHGRGIAPSADGGPCTSCNGQGIATGTTESSAPSARRPATPEDIERLARLANDVASASGLPADAFDWTSEGGDSEDHRAWWRTRVAAMLDGESSYSPDIKAAYVAVMALAEALGLEHRR